MVDHPVIDDVTVVVPTIGRSALEGCLRSIVAGSAWPSALVVVDQGDDPERVDRWLADVGAAGLGVRHIRSDRRGIGAAMNLGFAAVGTPLVAVTHDDCRVAADWLANLAPAVRAAGDAIVTGRVDPLGDGRVLTVVTRAERARFDAPRLDGDDLFPANMGVARHVIDRIGAFDEHPALRVAGEDNEWAYRALRRGIAIVYDPAVRVGHLADLDDDAVRATYRRYARGQGAFYGRHLRRGDRFIARRAGRDLLRAPWLLLRGLATRNPDLRAMGRGEVLGLLPGIVAGIRRAPEDDQVS